MQVRGSYSEAVLEWMHFVAVASAGADLWRICFGALGKPETGQNLVWREAGGLVPPKQQGEAPRRIRTVHAGTARRCPQME